MERETMQDSKEFVMPQVQATLAGNLVIGQEGEHQIKSTLETSDQAEAYLEKATSKLVTLEPENAKCAVCIDGRGCRCLASDVTGGGGSYQSLRKHLSVLRWLAVYMIWRL